MTTPAPWRWVVSPKSFTVELSRGAYGDTVMAFRRWGMSGAQPWFRRADGILVSSHDVSEPQKGREHHADWWRVINHPDARLIEAAPDLFAACEASVARCQFNCTTESYCGRCEPLIAAIAKAKAVTR